MDLENVVAPLCVKGCGFYGSEENRNMCSKCYKDFLKAELIAKSAKALDMEKQKPLNTTTSNIDSDSSSTTTTCSGSRIKNRCKNCNKKVGLTGFKCRCGHLFCGLHRYPKEHACTFDFKKADRDILFKENPLISADKLGGRI